MALNKIDSSAQHRLAGLSPSAYRLLMDAGKALSRMQPDPAERALISVLAMSPRSAEANRLMGIVSQMRGEFVQAVAFLRQALNSCPDDATILMNLGSALYETGAINESLVIFQRACNITPELASAWYNLGKALKSQAHIQPACSALHRALDLDPAHVLARISLADSQINLGNISDAVANYREILRRHPGNHDAWYALANIKTVQFSASDAAQLQHLFRQSGLAADACISIGFALAKALEDQQNYSASFEALHAANTLKRRYVDWNTPKQQAHVEAIVAAFTKPATAPLDPRLGREVIFIVGMPRSGSTLIEQILASHPEVEGANEITDLPQVIEDESRRRGQPFPDWVKAVTAEDWSRLGKEYLDRTKRWRKQRPLHTDKNLITWELVGAIRQMLPGAKIVNSQRDPVETCFACYRQLFSNGAHFSYDLDDMADYYLGYDHLMRYWRKSFPGGIFDHVYESLLTDTEAQIRSLLNFCSLEFDSACVAFHHTGRTVMSTASAAQVRQPLRQHTSRVSLYGTRLDTLSKRLHSLP